MENIFQNYLYWLRKPINLEEILKDDDENNKVLGYGFDVFCWKVSIVIRFESF